MLAGTIFSSGFTFKLVNDNKKDNNDKDKRTKNQIYNPVIENAPNNP